MKIIQHRSIILLNMKCPQLSKPKAKAAAKEPKLHHVTKWRKKPLGETRLSRGPVLLWPCKAISDISNSHILHCYSS